MEHKISLQKASYSRLLGYLEDTLSASCRREKADISLWREMQPGLLGLLGPACLCWDVSSFPLQLHEHDSCA